eukprot:gene7199-7413_t
MRTSSGNACSPAPAVSGSTACDGSSRECSDAQSILGNCLPQLKDDHYLPAFRATLTALQRRIFVESLVRRRESFKDGQAAAEAGGNLTLMQQHLIDKYKDKHNELDCALLNLMAPGLRLVLAAEVAAGMLCPGRPPPTDRPEHAAALQLFVLEAFEYAEQEGRNPYQQNHDGSSSKSLEDRLRQLWDPSRCSSSGPAPPPDLTLSMPQRQGLEVLLQHLAPAITLHGQIQAALEHSSSNNSATGAALTALWQVCKAAADDDGQFYPDGTSQPPTAGQLGQQLAEGLTCRPEHGDLDTNCQVDGLTGPGSSKATELQQLAWQVALCSAVWQQQSLAANEECLETWGLPPANPERRDAQLMVAARLCISGGERHRPDVSGRMVAGDRWVQGTEGPEQGVMGAEHIGRALLCLLWSDRRCSLQEAGLKLDNSQFEQLQRHESRGDWTVGAVRVGKQPDEGDGDYSGMLQLLRAADCTTEEQQSGHHGLRHKALLGASGGSSDSGGGPSSFSSPAVSWTDPFMWRRLLWQLLGKLNPAAQGFYATYLGMCPHVLEPRVWPLIKQSILRCLWSPAGADVTDLHLTSQPDFRKVKQYARALNSAFIKVYQASFVLAAQQVLLGLSPLHHSVLPAPETAGLCPSSFKPACRQRQLIDVGAPAAAPVVAAQLHAVAFSLRQLSNVTQATTLSNIPDKDKLLAGLQAAAAQVFLRLHADSRAQAELGLMSGCLVGSAAASLAAQDPQVRAQAARVAEAVMQEIQHDVLLALSEPRHLLAVAPSSIHQRARHPPLSKEVVKCLVTYWAEAATGDSKTHQQEPEQEGPTDESHIQHQETSEASSRHSSGAISDVLLSEQHLLASLDMQDEFLTDSEALLVHGSVNVDALINPKVWWHHQQKILGLQGRCDVCGTDAPRVLQCADCKSAVWCSLNCKVRDAAHDSLCSRLQERFPASGNFSCPCPDCQAKAGQEDLPPPPGCEIKSLLFNSSYEPHPLLWAPSGQGIGLDIRPEVVLQAAV